MLDPWKKRYTNLDSILKSWDITFPTKVHIIKAMVFPVCPVRMWELDHKEGCALKNWHLWIVVLEKTLKSPLDFKEIKPVNPKEINPEYSLEGLMLKLKLQYFGYLIWWADSLEKTQMLGRNEYRWRSGWQRMRWLHSVINSMGMSLSEPWETVKDREAWCTADHEVAKHRTWLNNWITTDI